MKSGRTMAAAAAMGWSLLAAIAVAGLTGCGGHKAGDVKTITLPGGVTMEMVWCPPGTFTMGSPLDEKGREGDDARLAEIQHRVKLTKGFWMAKHEVTQAQWEAVMGTTVRQQMELARARWPSGMNTSWMVLRGEGSDYPMYYVSWDEAQAFCRKAGNGLRLPTEAQWEYACRAGSTEAYAGTERLNTMGWYNDNSQDTSHPVGQRHPNAWGLHDMHGNVDEWCLDWCEPYLHRPVEDPVEDGEEGDLRCVRGGDWKSNPYACRSAFRGVGVPHVREERYGFRPCCSD